MFGSVVLEVGIGVILTFTLFSVILSALQEGIEAVFKRRAKDLEKTIAAMLGTEVKVEAESETQSEAQSGITKPKEIANPILVKFYGHPLIDALFPKPYGRARGDWVSGLPAYIPKEHFAAALLDFSKQAEAAVAKAIKDGQDVAAAADTILPAPIRQRLAEIQNSASMLAETEKERLEAWYDGAMDRLNGQFKRHSQIWLFCLGLAAAITANIDPFTIGNELAKNQQLRADLVAAAPLLQAELKVEGTQLVCAKPDADKSLCATQSAIAAHLSDELTGAGLPVGWGAEGNVFANVANGYKADSDIDFWKIIGFVIMALGGLMGAPFWFDLLNKFVNFRSSLKPK